ncbi:MAG: sigma-70 family RNA polymerase sigma factor [Cyanobacteria bacterium J06641_5]
MDRSDADLMQALQKGDTCALGALYDRHAGVVFGIALKILGNSEDAEDLTQEIFLQLWRKPKAYKTNRGALRSYLATLTRSRAIDLLRSRTSQFNVLQRCRQLFQARGAVDDLLDLAAGAEQAQVVQIALAQLPERQQEVLRLRFYERYSFSQIAQHLELPLGTVKTRSRQGLLALRSHMAAMTPPARPNPSDL